MLKVILLSHIFDNNRPELTITTKIVRMFLIKDELIRVRFLAVLEYIISLIFRAFS